MTEVNEIFSTYRACLSVDDCLFGWKGSVLPSMKHVRDETYLCQVLYKISFVRVSFTEWNLIVSMLNRTIWIRSPHSTRAILQGFDKYCKKNINWIFFEWQCIRCGDCLKLRDCLSKWKVINPRDFLESISIFFWSNVSSSESIFKVIFLFNM